MGLCNGPISDGGFYVGFTVLGGPITKGSLSEVLLYDTYFTVPDRIHYPLMKQYIKGCCLCCE